MRPKPTLRPDDARQSVTLIATLGKAPEVVTKTLDLLLTKDLAVREVVVLHTNNREAEHAVALLQSEFRQTTYKEIEFRSLLLRDQENLYGDLDDEPALKALLQMLFREIRQAHNRNHAVHIGIAGGRKVMAIAAMVIAQLLFTENDAIWHLFSDMYDPDDQRLHATPEQNSRLVQVPVLRYGNATQMLAAFAELGDAHAAISLQEQLIAGDMMRRRREFVERWLTSAEREVVRLVCEGLDNQNIARKLHKSVRTVANQLTAVYEKFHEWRGFPVGTISDRSMLIATFAPYFVFSGIAV